MLDGAGVFTIFARIILPNKYMQEAQHITQEIREKNPGMKIKITPRGVRMTITMITTIPVLCSYPFLQRYLIKGLLIGAVKG